MSKKEYFTQCVVYLTKWCESHAIMSLLQSARNLLIKTVQEKHPDAPAEFAAWSEERDNVGYSAEELHRAVQEGFYWIPYHPLTKRAVDNLIAQAALSNRDAVRQPSFWAPFPPLSDDEVDALIANRETVYDRLNTIFAAEDSAVSPMAVQLFNLRHLLCKCPLFGVDMSDGRVFYTLVEASIRANEMDDSTFQKALAGCCGDLHVEGNSLKEDCRAVGKEIYRSIQSIRLGDDVLPSHECFKWWLLNMFPKAYEYLVAYYKC